MIFSNGYLFLEDGCFHKKNIQIRGTSIVAFPQDVSNDSVIDISGCYLIPGLIDTHFHGCMGADFSDATLESLKTICSYELSCGITSLLPASMTLMIPTLEQIMLNYAKYKDLVQPNNTADFIGIYLEGPFLSLEKAGAQPIENICNPDFSLFEHLQELSNHQIKVVALAPESHGSVLFLDQISHTDTIVSIAHTTANSTILSNAFSHGASRVTHMYNAMSFPEELLALAAQTKNCMVEIICDGIHNNQARIVNIFNKMGDDRVILISDSMRATGLGDGISSLGGQTVLVKGKEATLANGKKAGSVSTLFDCFRTALDFGIPLESVVKSVTVNPAKSLHLEDRIGTLKIGSLADFLVLSPDYHIQHIIKRGIIKKTI